MVELLASFLKTNLRERAPRATAGPRSLWLLLAVVLASGSLAFGQSLSEESGMLEITAGELLEHSVIRAEIEAAWSDAGFGTPQAHEEGGWIYRSSSRHARPTYLVKRWPSGPTCSTATGCGITPQSPAEIPGFVLVAEFHVHPMPEKNEHGKSTGFAVEPSSADLKAAQDLELLGIVRNQFGYDPYNGYGCGPDDGCTGGGEMLAVGGSGEGATDAAALAQGKAEADRASSYLATGTGVGSGISRPTLDR